MKQAVITVIVIGLAGIAAFIGYRYFMGKSCFLGNDLINLFLFTPLMIIALVLLKRGTDKGRLFWLGIQALITYDYIHPMP